MYLEHFNLNEFPFSLTPNTNFYCDLPTHQEALNVLMLGLKRGEGFIKITGEVGTGKTMLCRLLLNTLDDQFVTAYIPNPDQNSHGLRLALAHELGLAVDKDTPQHLLLDMITKRLLELHKDGKQIVLIIDESQALPEEGLEAVRLLTNLETEEQKLLQVVLFGQPELDVKLNKPGLRQLKQRITFSYHLKPLNKKELELYLCHRLAKAGFTYGMIFSSRARKMLFRASGGLPRLLNVLCHKALLVSYGRGVNVVDVQSMKRAIVDTESTMPKKSVVNANYLLGVTTSICLVVIYIIYRNAGLI
jgi:MSHA biogenesis protein MshM